MPTKRKKKRAAPPRRKTKKKMAARKVRQLTIKVSVPSYVDLQGPDLGELTSEQRLQLAAMGCKKVSTAPQWADEKLWRQAMRNVSPHWKRYQFPYAAVAFVFLRLGGKPGHRAHREAPARARAGGGGRVTQRSARGDGVAVERVELDELGYSLDSGKYYGVGEPVWRVTSEHPYIDQVVRARTASGAKAQVMERHQH